MYCRILYCTMEMVLWCTVEYCSITIEMVLWYTVVHNGDGIVVYCRIL